MVLFRVDRRMMWTVQRRKTMLKTRLRMNLQLFAEGDAATFEINGQQMTAEQVVDNYKKLQADHTKVTQKNSELSKNEEKVKPWVEFDKFLDESGIDKTAVGQAMDKIITDLKAGKAPTAATMEKLDTQIDNEKDKATKAQLEALQEHVYEVNFEKELNNIEKTAKEDGIEFTQKEFTTYLTEYLEELGLSDDDDFDMKHINKAYKLFKADKIVEGKKVVPPLGTSGGAGAVTKGDDKKVGGLPGAAARARELFGR